MEGEHQLLQACSYQREVECRWGCILFKRLALAEWTLKTLRWYTQSGRVKSLIGIIHRPVLQRACGSLHNPSINLFAIIATDYTFPPHFLSWYSRISRIFGQHLHGPPMLLEYSQQRYAQQYCIKTIARAIFDMSPSSQTSRSRRSFLDPPRELRQDILIRTFTLHRQADFIQKVREEYL